MEPVRCAVVGLGWIGTIHAHYLNGAPQAELAACCDHRQETTRGFPGTPVYGSLEEAIEAQDLEAVVVATPPDAHREVVVPALEQGLHVLCEKPLARDLDDADAMIAAADATGGRLVVGHIRRFDPRFVTLAEAVEDGRVGRPIHLSGTCNCPREDAVRLGRSTTLALECGVHDLDAMRWLAGDIERVHAEGANVFAGDCVDAFSASLRFSSGAVGTLSHSWAMPDATPVDWEFQFQVGGVGGLAEIDGRSRGVTVLSGADTVLHPDAFSWPRLHGIIGGSLAIQDAAFLAGVREEQTWPLSLADARAAVAAGLAIDRSIAQQRPIELTELE